MRPIATAAPVPRVILLYNVPADDIGSWPDACAEGCRFIRDPRRLLQADAVVFHVPTLPAGRPPPKRPGQTWVAYSMESDVNCPALADPAFMAAFDLTMTYRRDADVWSPYFGPRLAADLLRPPVAKTEPAPAVYFCRNSRDRSGRAHYVAELMDHLAVDSYGPSLRNRPLPVEDRGRETKLTVIARYRFTLAFENSISPDYVTEKFFDPLLAGSVPVYLGAPNVEQYAPGRRCVIRVSEFPGPAALAEHLQALAGDDAAYAELLAWKQEGLRPEFLALIDRLRTPAPGRLCALLHARAAVRGA